MNTSGVPRDEPRNCAKPHSRAAIEPWRVPSAQYFTVSSVEADALASVRAHEQRIRKMGGIDVIVLGLGQNGHLGFNEPESERRQCPGRAGRRRRGPRPGDPRPAGVT